MCLCVCEHSCGDGDREEVWDVEQLEGGQGWVGGIWSNIYEINK